MQRHTYQTCLPYPYYQISILIITAWNIRKKGSKGALLGAQNRLQMKTLLSVWLDNISGAVSATNHPCRQGVGTWRACGLYSAPATGNQKRETTQKQLYFEISMPGFHFSVLIWRDCKLLINYLDNDRGQRLILHLSYNGCDQVTNDR